MYPKDTSSDDPGPAHTSEGGGVQTESGMRRSIFRDPSSPSTSAPSTAPLATSDNPSPNNLNITVAPFTGGPFEVKVSKMDTVDELKKVIARRLKVSKERIYLLYRESELIEGSVSTNLLVDGSTVTLLPRAETGLISPKPEQSVMQALESLNEQQVNDFLSGAAPLNLTMRLGDHMMLIQLQLSTVNQASSASSSGSSSGSSRRQKSTIQISSPPPYPTPPPSAPTSPSSDPAASSSSSSVSHSHAKKVRVPLLSPGGLYPAPPPGKSSAHSGPLPQTIHRNYNPNQTQTPNTRDAFSRKSRSSRDGGSDAARGPPPPQAAQGSESSGGGEPPAKKPKLDTNALAEASKNLTQTLKQLSSEVLTTRTDSQETGPPAPGTTAPPTSQIPKKETPSPSSSSSSSSTSSSSASSSSSSSSGSSSGSERRHGRKRHSGRGAIIESMHHHGKGVYSGTFSGTLNPALQDEHGQPKRDITTIVHILNDLLCAQYKAYGGSSSGSSRSSKHHHRESKSSSQHSEAKSAVFDAEARAASEKQRQEEQVSVTRHKVEALRKIMEERKAKREARRQAKATPGPASAASYSTAWSVSEAREAEQEAEHFLQQPEPVTA